MKWSTRDRLRRRDLMRLLGSAALALPALELFEPEARAQATGKKSKFAVFCYTNDGVNHAAFWPRGRPDNYTLSPILAPFESFRDKMLILGPQMNGSQPVTNTGLTYLERPAQHQAPVCLTARKGSGCMGQFCEGNLGLSYLNQLTAVNKLDGPSIDQVIAKAVKGDSTFASLNFGLHPVGGDTPSDINYQEDGTPLKRLAGADEAWTHVFGNLVPPAGNGAASAVNKHTALTNFLNERFATLRPALSAADRTVLDGHLTAFRTYEERQKKRLDTSGTLTGMECTNSERATVATDSDSIRTGADTETLCPFFMDLITTSFACNLTKVASITFGYPGGGDAGGLRMPWLGFSDPLHFVSHHAGNATLLDKYQKMSTWMAGQIAGLMQRLAAHPSATGTGTLLDETTIYWFNRHGDGDTHANFALPNVILGGTGGYFAMGRWLQMPATNPTQVLISIANAMGVDVPSFGEPALRATSPLAGLIA